MRYFLFFGLLLCGLTSLAQGQDMESQYKAIEGKVIEWRRDIHQNPELSNREFKTAEKIANHLKSLGIEIQTAATRIRAVRRSTGVVLVHGRETRRDSDHSKRRDLPVPD